MFNTVKLMCAAGLLVAMGVSLGCSPSTASGVRANWSPELRSMARTSEQHRTMEARTIDTNLRQIWDDGAMILLLDRPVRLTRYPVP